MKFIKYITDFIFLEDEPEKVDAVLREEKATNTYENAFFSKE